MFVLVSFLIFSGALLAAAYYVFSVPRQEEGNAVATRLRELRSRTGQTRRTGGDLMRRESQGKFAFLSEFVAWIGLLRRLQEYIDQANLKYRAVDVFAVSVMLGAGSYFFLGVVGMSMLLLRIVFALLIGAIPIMFVSQKRKRRLAKFEELFPDAIDLFNRSMKAGHTIHSGLETIAQESLEPVKMEFKKVIEELSLGSQLDAALLNLGKRIPIVDLKFFITGLILQRQTGANMVEVLDNLALLVRERLNMAAKMKAHTAQQRLSAGLLCALPVVFGLGLAILKPENFDLLIHDDTGSFFFTYAIISEIIGILIIRKLANPRF
ncbi:MAG: type II secretion system F family protein [Bryobacterales bacterium]|nr:type II secretion system F family protein [Bryobacterales bacterium]